MSGQGLGLNIQDFAKLAVIRFGNCAKGFSALRRRSNRFTAMLTAA
jgi:hypothetical protein